MVNNGLPYSFGPECFHAIYIATYLSCFLYGLIYDVIVSGLNCWLSKSEGGTVQIRICMVIMVLLFLNSRI